LTSDTDANNERYYFSTQDKPNLAGVEETTLDIAKTQHFTNMNFKMLSGDSSELQPGTGGGGGGVTPGGSCDVAVSGKTGPGNPTIYYAIGAEPAEECTPFGTGANRTYLCLFAAEPETDFSIRRNSQTPVSLNVGLCSDGSVSILYDF
jgi:hypothetical protein